MQTRRGKSRLVRSVPELNSWTNRDTACRFRDYATVMAETLGDRVAVWATLNEPCCWAYLGYASGVHAPGRTDAAGTLTAVHHLSLAHGLASQALRAGIRDDAPLSITINPVSPRTPTDSDADLDAKRRIDGIANRIFFDPLFRGQAWIACE